MPFQGNTKKQKDRRRLSLVKTKKSIRDDHKTTTTSFNAQQHVRLYLLPVPGPLFLKKEEKRRAVDTPGTFFSSTGNDDSWRIQGAASISFFKPSHRCCAGDRNRRCRSDAPHTSPSFNSVIMTLCPLFVFAVFFLLDKALDGLQNWQNSTFTSPDICPHTATTHRGPEKTPPLPRSVRAVHVEDAHPLVPAAGEDPVPVPPRVVR